MGLVIIRNSVRLAFPLEDGLQEGGALLALFSAASPEAIILLNKYLLSICYKCKENRRTERLKRLVTRPVHSAS